MTAPRVLILDLKDDPELIGAYEEYHRPGGVPQAILDSIRGAGIEDMEIYRSGNRLIMLMATSAQFDADAKAAADTSDPEVIAWEALMDQFQQRIPWATAGTKWLQADRIFSLSEHTGVDEGASDSSCDTL